MTQRLDQMLLEVQSQRDQLMRLTRAYTADAAQLDRFHMLAEAWDVRRIQAHVRDVVAAAPMLTDPFPHLIIHPLLPPEAFSLLLEAIPPDDFFEGDNPRKRDIRKLESSTLPLLSMAIWRSLARDVSTPCSLRRRLSASVPLRAITCVSLLVRNSWMRRSHYRCARMGTD